MALDNSTRSANGRPGIRHHIAESPRRQHGNDDPMADFPLREFPGDENEADDKRQRRPFLATGQGD